MNAKSGTEGKDSGASLAPPRAPGGEIRCISLLEGSLVSELSHHYWTGVRGKVLTLGDRLLPSSDKMAPGALNPIRRCQLSCAGGYTGRG